MRLPRLNLSPFKIVRAVHVVAVVAAVATLVVLGRELYIGFYLPYTFTDEVQVPATTNVAPTRADDLTETTLRLKATRGQASLDPATIGDVFASQPVPTSTEPAQPQ